MIFYIKNGPRNRTPVKLNKLNYFDNIELWKNFKPLVRLTEDMPIR